MDFYVCKCVFTILQVRIHVEVDYWWSGIVKKYKHVLKIDINSSKILSGCIDGWSSLLQFCTCLSSWMTLKMSKFNQIHGCLILFI